ncbi:MAG: hypothetical protein M3N68_07845, partial [Actinomycetota bacterium]|nr:hypothetical protein [Actinomycetota bacterium]
MARRIDVELTSAREDGTWTWRVAGAKQPRGVMNGTLLSEGARVGDVVRVEADFEIDGIFVTSVLPTREKKRSEPERVEVIGPPREHRGVTSSLTSKPEAPRRPARRQGQGAGRRAPGGESPERPDGPGRPPHPARVERPGRPPRDRNGRDGRAPRRDAGRPEQDGNALAGRNRRGEHPEPAGPPKAKRLSPANVHRAAVLASLPPEQRPIAEQVLRGGIPAVRHAVELQNAQLREQGRQEVRAEPLVAIAEQLLPELKRAEWRDRAEAAAKAIDEIALRDLRSVVAGAEAAARDDESRLLARTLREALQRRLSAQRERWIAEITAALDEGRLVRALRASARPPDPAARFPAELALRMSEAASTAMAPEVTPDRWATLLDAVADSPVRRSVKPAGLPTEAGNDLLQAARQASGRVPALAGLLGIEMPPPPGPAGHGRPTSGPSGPARRARRGGPR